MRFIVLFVATLLIALMACRKVERERSWQVYPDLIVLVDIRDYGNEEISEGLRIISAQRPAVVAIDEFLDRFNGTRGDSLLALAIADVERMVLMIETDSLDNAVKPHENFVHPHHVLGINSVSVDEDDFVKSYVPLYETSIFPTAQFLNFAEQVVAVFAPDNLKITDWAGVNVEVPIEFNWREADLNIVDLKMAASANFENKIVMIGDLNPDHNIFNILIGGKVYRTNPTVIYANIVLNRLNTLSNKPNEPSEWMRHLVDSLQRQRRR